MPHLTGWHQDLKSYLWDRALRKEDQEILAEVVHLTIGIKAVEGYTIIGK
jgi:hypothetical protein